MGRRADRFMTHFEKEELTKQGVRYLDQFCLRPAMGHPKEFELKRTLYDVYLQKKQEVNIEGTKIELPALNQKCSHYQIFLAKTEGQAPFNEHSRYMIRSLSGAPFKINGTYSFESFLMRGDIVDLGFNRLEFKNVFAIEEEFSFPQLTKKVIESNLNIVLQGETGTGKTRLARMIHEQSGLSGEFIHINLQALAPGLVESELFGHMKGAFTGALHDKKGAFRSAQRGTLFLDEIDSLSLDLQTKLLLFLDDQKVRPVGSERSYDCRTRLIFASGKPLLECVETQKMRPDFYYRLTSGASVLLPSLKSNTTLISRLLERYCFEHDCAISQRLKDYYQCLDWPGNIRQMFGHLDKKRAMGNCRRLDFCALDDDLKVESQLEIKESVQNILPLEEVKRLYCKKIYLRFAGNLSLSAKVLKVSSNTLRAALDKQAA